MAKDAPALQATAVLAATVGSSVMIAQQVASRATRDALFLTAYSVRVLPMMVLTGAALSLVSVLVATKLMARFGPARVAPFAFAANAALFLLDYLLAHVAAKVAAVVLYLHIAILGATVISIFWSLVSERFDPHTCKKFIGRIGAGGTLGGIVGGLLAWNASMLLSVRSNLAIMGGLNIVCAIATIRVARRARVASDEPEETADPMLAVLGSSRYLRTLAMLVFAIAVSDALLDYVFNSAAAARYRTGPELIRFFAIFHTAAALITFLLQMGFAQRALARFGPGGVIAILPLTVIGGGLASIGSPTLLRLVTLRGAATAIANSLFRSGYELFYAPVPSEKKRSTKTAIDVGFDRVGTFVGGGVTLLVLYLIRDRSIELLLVIAVTLAFFVLYLSRALSRHYVEALAESLKADSPPAVAVVAAPVIVAARVSVNDTSIVADVETLVAGDATRITALLARGPLDVRIVGHVLPLLATDALAAPALRALRAVAPRIVGSLGDALLDPHATIDERRRLPIVLRAAPSQRTCDLLLFALSDPSFEVRFQVGMALAHVLHRAPELKVDDEVIFAAVLREVETDRATWESRLALEPEEEGGDFEWMDAYLRLKTSRGLQYIFALLSLCLDRQPIQLAFAALSTEDDDLRGTALEYLENVLPEKVRDALWPFLNDRRALRPQRRERSTVVQQLVSRGADITSILDAMRKQQPV
jgi:ATP:ADP antiporter, AAA family